MLSGLFFRPLYDGEYLFSSRLRRLDLTLSCPCHQASSAPFFLWGNGVTSPLCSSLPLTARQIVRAFFFFLLLPFPPLFVLPVLFKMASISPGSSERVLITYYFSPRLRRRPGTPSPVAEPFFIPALAFGCFFFLNFHSLDLLPLPLTSDACLPSHSRPGVFPIDHAPCPLYYRRGLHLSTTSFHS